VALTCVVLTVAVAGCSSPAASTTRPSQAPAAGAAPNRPNIVFVLTDDLSTNLVPYMPHVGELAKAGTTFDNYTVTDSLCCPSRASIFTGKFPHDTGVFTNTGDDGGFAVFTARGEERSTFATSLQAAGYRTALMGKYLNGYQPKSRYVPPGWNEWAVTGNGYPEFKYILNVNGRIEHHADAEGDYLTDVLAARASGFIAASAAARKPFLLEVATFAPHAPYTPAPRDANLFPGLTAPRTPAFNALPGAAPAWLANRGQLTPRQTESVDGDFRKRVQAVQAVDRLIGTLQAALDKAGLARDTVLVFSSDNGYHMGEHRLSPGKQTAFDTDIRVPLVMAGPGVAAGRAVPEPVENIDLRPTFEALAGAATPAEVDGRSLVPLLSGAGGAGWRTTALVEHHGPNNNPGDPDRATYTSGNPPTYQALRTATATYVEYADGTREYYDRRTDPYELNNVAARLPANTLAHLHSTLQALTNCHGEAACWAAAHD
jgi:N-acetylglucosamine-6-sulfatase